MAEWLVKLQGNTYDLDVLVELISDEDMFIFKKEDGYWLRSPQFETLTESDEVRNLAEPFLERCNGAARIFLGEFQPVGIAHIVRLNEDGTRNMFVTISGEARARGGVQFSYNSGEGFSTPQLALPSSARNLKSAVVLGKDDANVVKVIRLVRQNQDWVTLYKVFEIIESDVEGRVSTLGWVTKADKERFKRTANSPEAIGDAARHGRSRNTPPPNPMSYEEARSFIRELFTGWIQYKRGTTL